MAPSVAPPTPQEINRKLSLHSPRTARTISATSTHVHDGTESDSDSALLTPEIPFLSAFASTGTGGIAANPPLSSIAEGRYAAGEESEEDDEEEEEEGGWRTADIRGRTRSSVDESVLKAGYLWKKGERRKTWKKRWFVLRPAHLAYYKTSAEYQLLRLLDLADVHSCTAIALKRHPNTLGLVSPVRTFYLQAESQTEVHEWVTAIEEARQNLMSTSTQTSMTSPITVPAGHVPDVHVQYSVQGSAPRMPPPSSRAYVTSSDSDSGSPTLKATVLSHHPPMAFGSSPARIAAVPQKDSSKIVLSGYLMKCGSKRRNWRKRWFVLNGEKLVYSASHMDTKPHREFSFSQILDALEYELPQKGPSSSTHPLSPHHPQSSASTDDGDDGHSPHTFKIVTTKRTLLLCSPSEEEEIKWLGAVRALIARRSGTGALSNIAAAKTTAPEALPPNTATVGSIDPIKGRPSAVGAGPVSEVIEKQP